MENIYNILNNYLRGSNKFGMNESIARFMLAYLDRIPQMKLTEIAARCHTSAPSVIRFCREMDMRILLILSRKQLLIKSNLQPKMVTLMFRYSYLDVRMLLKALWKTGWIVFPKSD